MHQHLEEQAQQCEGEVGFDEEEHDEELKKLYYKKMEMKE
jgi:hypothetical protein